MTTFTAIAFDPGGTTGWAWYRATMMPVLDADEQSGLPTGAREWYDVEWFTGQLSAKDHMDELLLLLETNHTAEYHVITERFVTRPGKIAADQEVARRYNTVMEMFCRERNVPFIQQQAAAAKGFVKNQNIKKLDLWTPGHVNRHAMDAMRHLLFWLTTGPYKRVDLLAKGWK